MAKNCCICGDNISAFGDSFDFSTPGGLKGQVCDRCHRALLNLAQGRATIEGVEQYRIAVDGFKARVHNEGGSRDIQREMMTVAETRLRVLTDKLEQK